MSRVPAAAATLSRTTPTMFWPRSKIHRPGVSSRIVWGWSSASTRTGSITGPSNVPTSRLSTTAAGQAAVVQPGLVPAGQFAPGVVRFAHHEIGGDNGAFMDPPARVGHDALRAAVAVGHFELGPQGRGLAPLLEPAKAHVAAIAAVAQQGGQGVLAGPQQTAHVVDLVADALVIIGPVGGHHVVADAAAVDPQLIEPQRGGIEPRLGDGPVGKRHRLTQDGRLRRCAIGVASPRPLAHRGNFGRRLPLTVVEVHGRPIVDPPGQGPSIGDR